MGWLKLLTQIETVLTRECRVEPQQQQQQQQTRQLEIGHDQKAKLMAALEGYRANPADFNQFVSFSSQGYTKNLVTNITRPPPIEGHNARVEANVIVMCWAPNQQSAFHGHEGSRCFVKVLQGRVLEERRPHPSGSLHEGSFQGQSEESKLLEENQVAYIDDQLACHRVTNYSAEEPAVTLHIYAPPYRKCRLFEANETRLTMTSSRLVDVVYSNGASGQSA